MQRQMNLTHSSYGLNTAASLLMSISGIFLITQLVGVLVYVMSLYDMLSLALNLPA